RAISFLRYYDSATVLKNGLQMGDVLLLLGIAAALMVIAVIGFRRRDLGV
ncbi:MAG: ABC transporter permease, partial [Candidatus Thermofonsia Clade 1 bacterium]